ncbi:DNA polymerase III, delta subunit [uncultured Desulfobacterium sp.]|uniref:DNA polymerase III subunit delta n=1 Tax=uncultured Desulfobacterium sp. TaxID=201089 RepID=A0A445N3D4_9BACT|nr:DNA polymerase III, delta subunit [uncultured Desulfobacterium sp.]
MAVELSPEDVLSQLDQGRIAPFYLFYGPSEYRLEKVLDAIRERLIPESARDLNLRIFYGDEIKSNHGEIIDTANSFPFLADHRLIIVRRTEDVSASALDSFVSYLERPVETTCLIFVSSKPDFRKKFYKTIKAMGLDVNFRELYDNQVVPWIMKMARSIGLNIDSSACGYLHQIVGNRLRDLASELEKIYLHYGKRPVGVAEVKEIALFSRSFTIFELVDHISFKRRKEAIAVLKRYMEEEGADAALSIIGMLTRQIRLLWQTKSVVDGGGRSPDIVKKLGVQNFLAEKLRRQSEHWSEADLERAFELLYQADGLIKSGSGGQLVLENVLFSM